MEAETVSEIIEPVFKQGVGSTGKPWSLAKIVTNTGKSATCFNPVIVGDEVEMAYNDKYKNWSAKVLKNKLRAQPVNDDISKVINLIFEQNEQILSRVNKLLGLGADTPLEKSPPQTGYDKFKETGIKLSVASKPDEYGNVDVVADVPDEPVNLDDIPF